MQALLFAFHPEESALLSFILKQAGFEVHLAKQLKPYVENWPENPLDLICLVLGPDYQKDINAIKLLRGQSVVPMVLITEPLPEDTEIQLMETGVDLVVNRPYGTRLLMSKIKALLRRSSGVPFHSIPAMTRGPFVLDPSSRTIKVEDRDQKKLTQLEFRLLYLLMTHANQIIPTDNIVEHVWGYSGEENRNLVRGLVQRLRSKVELDKKNPTYILSERGIGYYFKYDD